MPLQYPKHTELAMQQAVAEKIRDTNIPKIPDIQFKQVSRKVVVEEP